MTPTPTGESVRFPLARRSPRVKVLAPSLALPSASRGTSKARPRRCSAGAGLLLSLLLSVALTLTPTPAHAKEPRAVKVSSQCHAGSEYYVFRIRNTSHRGWRFDFDGRVENASAWGVWYAGIFWLAPGESQRYRVRVMPGHAGWVTVERGGERVAHRWLAERCGR